MPKFRQNPFVLDMDLFCLMRDLGQTRTRALVCALVAQRIARMQIQVKPKQLSLSTEELLDLFCFVGPRTLKRCILLLREAGIWKNTRYRPQHNMKSYTNIRISWPAIAKAAGKVETKKEKQALKELAKRLNNKKDKK